MRSYRKSRSRAKCHLRRLGLLAAFLFLGIGGLESPARAQAFCGDGWCDETESWNTCPEDCWFPVCGDGWCDETESWETCPEDCLPPAFCGDGACYGGEDCSTCATDCGLCPPINVVQAYTCPDTDTRFVGECPGQCGPRCMGVWASGPVIKKWTCECLKQDLSASTCETFGIGCVGSQAAADWSLTNQPDLGPQGINSCDLTGAPTPAQYCSYYGYSETKPVKLGLEPCQSERILDAKYLGADYHHKWAEFYSRWRYIGDKDVATFTLSEAGRFKLGISCVATGYGVIRVGPDSLLCRALGKCTGDQLRSLSEWDINFLAGSPGCTPIDGSTGTGGGCAEIPFYHKCAKHGFGWYDATQVPAGTYIAFVGAGSGFFGLIDGHGTMDTYVYEGGGGLHYALGSTGCPQDQPPPPPPEETCRTRAECTTF